MRVRIFGTAVEIGSNYEEFAVSFLTENGISCKLINLNSNGHRQWPHISFLRGVGMVEKYSFLEYPKDGDARDFSDERNQGVDTRNFLDWPILEAKKIVNAICRIDKAIPGLLGISLTSREFLYCLENLMWPKTQTGEPYLPEKEINVIADVFLRPGTDNLKRAEECADSVHGMPTHKLAAFCLSIGRLPDRHEASKMKEITKNESDRVR